MKSNFIIQEGMVYDKEEIPREIRYQAIPCTVWHVDEIRGVGTRTSEKSEALFVPDAPYPHGEEFESRKISAEHGVEIVKEVSYHSKTVVSFDSYDSVKLLSFHLRNEPIGDKNKRVIAEAILVSGGYVDRFFDEIRKYLIESGKLLRQRLVMDRIKKLPDRREEVQWLRDLLLETRATADQLFVFVMTGEKLWKNQRGKWWW